MALLKKPRHGATEKNQNATGAGARAKTPGNQLPLNVSYKGNTWGFYFTLFLRTREQLVLILLKFLDILLSFS